MNLVDGVDRLLQLGHRPIGEAVLQEHLCADAGPDLGLAARLGRLQGAEAEGRRLRGGAGLVDLVEDRRIPRPGGPVGFLDSAPGLRVSAPTA